MTDWPFSTVNSPSFSATKSYNTISVAPTTAGDLLAISDSAASSVGVREDTIYGKENVLLTIENLDENYV